MHAESESDHADLAEAGLLSGDERSHSTYRPATASQRRHARLKELQQHQTESLRIEEQRARGRAADLPILQRRRLANELDQRAKDEQRWHEFEDSQCSQGSSSSGEELGDPRRRLHEKQTRLEDLRTRRRLSDSKAEEAIVKELRTHPLREHIDRRNPETHGRSSSTERSHGSSGDEAERLHRPTSRSTRSIGKRVFHPRRGVGTDW